MSALCGQGCDVNWNASGKGGVRDGDGEGAEERGDEGSGDGNVGGRSWVVEVGAEEMWCVMSWGTEVGVTSSIRVKEGRRSIVVGLVDGSG